jgi:cellulose synthase/poly-beta-1,6-N-acetylglucosamine synthase-like glycosyltransferase
MTAYDLATFVMIILAVLMLAIFCAWLYFFIYTIMSFKRLPKLESISQQQQHATIVMDKYPKVSIILPARNEEKYISKCLDSLINQSYPNFEIVAINDSSSDRTGEIIERYHILNPKVVAVINTEPKPAEEKEKEGWIGKNWACYQGYLNSTGEIFLFTDADTVHSRSTMYLAVTYLIKQNLDALTAIPKILSYYPCV